MFSRSETEGADYVCGWTGVETCFDPATRVLMLASNGQPVHYCARHAEIALTSSLAVEAEQPSAPPKPKQGSHYEGKKRHFPGDGCCT